nr:hypothetical protein [Tanacetum cinerariifolium]
MSYWRANVGVRMMKEIEMEVLYDASRNTTPGGELTYALNDLEAVSGMQKGDSGHSLGGHEICWSASLCHCLRPCNVEFLIVADDHFTKWIQAKQMATITEKKVLDFVYGTEAVIHAEIRIPTTRVALIDQDTNEEALRLN